MIATYWRFDDGTWGARIVDADRDVTPGAELTITKRDGSAQGRIVGAVVWLSDDRTKALVELEEDAWIARASEARLVDVFAELGIEVRHRRCHPCPACGESHRSSSDQTKGPVSLAPSGEGWACHRCGAKGDAIDAVAFTFCRTRFRDADEVGRATVRALFASRGWCSPAPGSAPPPIPVRPRPTAPAPAPMVPALDPAEIQALWDACLPLDVPPADATRAQQDAWCTVAGWQPPFRLAASKASLPLGVAALDLARVLPPGPLPKWATCAGEPWSAGWGLIVPVWDATGDLAGLRARWTNQRRPAPGRRKEIAARGARCAGTVYSCPVGVAVLRGARAIEDEHGRLEWDGRVVIGEGGKDLLVWRCADAALPVLADDGTWRTHAVFSVWSGSWSAELAARIPDGTFVSVATDADEKGDEYASKIAASLGGRCSVVRWRPPLVEAAA